MGLEYTNFYQNEQDRIAEQLTNQMKQINRAAQKLMMVDCSQLPYDIIRLIAIRLHAVEDFLSFSFVCHSWRSFYLTKSWTTGPQIPWLMLSDNENSDIRSFFSLYKNKVYELELPEARGRRCWGSPHGWIVIIGSDLEIHLLNPFSRACINLPPQSTFDSQFDFHSAWYKFIDKAIIIKKSNESHTIEEEFLVMVIYGPHQDLAFSRPGYSSWVNVEVSSCFRFIDVVLFNDQIFALCYVGNLVVIDIDAPGPPTVLYIAPPPHQLAWEKLYLVESSGDLLMAYRYEYVTLSGYPSLTQFEVYKFDLSMREWTKLEDLSNMALFVGDNYSMSVSSSNIFNCECNKIYFITDTVEQWWSYNESFIGRDVGMYCMVDGTVEPFFFGSDYPSYYSCPIWVMPSLS